MSEVSSPQKKRGRQGEGGGPKPTPIDVDQVRTLASIQCTYEEIAAVIKISKRQFIDRINASPELRDAIDEGWANGRASLRRQQFRLLEAGNATMGVWLGKQYLGQRDQIGVTGGDGGPVKHAINPLESITRELSRLAERNRAEADSRPVQQPAA